MIEKLKRRIPDAQDEALLQELLDEAGAFIRAYTRREALSPEMQSAQVRVAAVLYNRMGMEGEASHSEGGVSRTAEALPGDLRAWLNSFRLARSVN